MEDHHVDRPDVEAGQPVQLTGTNSSFGLIVLIIKEIRNQRTEDRRRRTEASEVACFFRLRSKVQFCFIRTTSDGEVGFPIGTLSSVVCFPFRSLPAWWLLQGDKTRSHPELGRQTPQRQWYFVSRHGRVGRRQACKERKTEVRRRRTGRPLACGSNASSQFTARASRVVHHRFGARRRTPA